MVYLDLSFLSRNFLFFLFLISNSKFFKSKKNLLKFETIDCNLTRLSSKSQFTVEEKELEKDLNIFEVLPIEFKKGKKIIHFYKRILVEDLTDEKLVDIYYNLNFKTLPSVADLLNFFLVTYKTKPPILISKRNGRLYSLKGKWDLAEVQHQASLVIRVLEYFGLVEAHQTKTVKRRKK